MGATVHIDIGGTFTDCVVQQNGQIAWGKSPTTGHNLSVGFMDAVRSAAEALGLGAESLLQETETIRYATTLAMNALIERKGPRLGFITTAGHQDAIFAGNGHQWGDGLPLREQRRLARAQSPQHIIPPEFVVTLKERIDSMGQVIIPLSEEEVLERVQGLVDAGVRGFVVCLMWSCVNPVHERRIREIIREEYPDVYLGNMPVILSSDVVPKWREYRRAQTTILSAFLHNEMTEQLVGLNDQLRDSGYKRPLQIVHNAGGVAKLSRTRPVDTYQSGPVAGLLGSAAIGKLYGMSNVICTDMGGTSFDMGVVADGEVRFYTLRPVIDRWLVDVPMIEVRSIGAGGGSIAAVLPEVGNRLEVGPRSAGSMPGPACYDQGGLEPTVTDADLVLGYLNPDYFLGGRMSLSVERAAEAIRERIADPLGLSVEEAAFAVKRMVDEHMASELLKDVALKGYDPRDFVLFAYGGAGPTHCCGYAGALGVRQIVTFPDAAVFCAYGASTLDTVHVYEQSRPMLLNDPARGQYLDDYDGYNRTVAGLLAEMERDMRSEGIAQDKIVVALELEIRYGTSPVTQRIASPCMAVHGKDDVDKILASFRTAFDRFVMGVRYPPAITRVESFIVRAVAATRGQALPARMERQGPDASAALKGQRRVCWDPSQGYVPTSIYDGGQLSGGNELRGPAIVEARDHTIVLPPGWHLRVDEYLNRFIEWIA